jgi:dolichyl-diphosphooligosaccharide--protein glycosyltransferase
MLTSPEKRAHKYIRHMADYVLVWAGGGGDDMAKSPHLARIANSVFPDHCGDADPRCHNFGFYRGGEPTPMMEKSLLYKLVMNGQGRATVDTTLFEEVHKTRYGYMRIYKVHNVSQKSKRWCADPANRKCDAPGSWYCEGLYPPSIEPLIKRRRNFAQLEDFNKKGGSKSAYSKLIEEEREADGEAPKKKKKKKKNAEL